MSKFNNFLKDTVELNDVQGGKKTIIDRKYCDGKTVLVYEHTFLGIHTGTSTETVTGDVKVD